MVWFLWQYQYTKAGSTIEGNYFGGIVGYSNQALVYNAVSALGRSGSFRYSSDDQKELLQGRYVAELPDMENTHFFRIVLQRRMVMYLEMSM